MHYALCFTLCTSTLYLTCFSFFFVDHTSKQVLSIQVVHPYFVKCRSSISYKCSSASVPVSFFSDETQHSYSLGTATVLKFQNLFVLISVTLRFLKVLANSLKKIFVVVSLSEFQEK